MSYDFILLLSGKQRVRMRKVRMYKICKYSVTVHTSHFTFWLILVILRTAVVFIHSSLSTHFYGQMSLYLSTLFHQWSFKANHQVMFWTQWSICFDSCKLLCSQIFFPLSLCQSLVAMWSLWPRQQQWQVGRQHRPCLQHMTVTA